jgi:cAMP-regulated phosphoprotein/endosulfine conserved region
MSWTQERKYFDSGDYALSKAGKASDVGVTQIGREHPVPENIPHSSSPMNGILSPTAQGHPHGHSGSPVKESSFLHRETSAEEFAEDGPDKVETAGKESADGSATASKIQKQSI